MAIALPGMTTHTSHDAVGCLAEFNHYAHARAPFARACRRAREPPTLGGVITGKRDALVAVVARARDHSQGPPATRWKQARCISMSITNLREICW